MKKLISTNKVLTRNSILVDLDFSCPEVIKIWRSFEEWAESASISTNTQIFREDLSIFWDEWLQYHPKAQTWLVENGYAMWKGVIVYSLNGREGTRQIYLKEEEGDIFVMCGGFYLLSLKEGTFTRRGNVPSYCAKVDNIGRIEEKE